MVRIVHGALVLLSMAVVGGCMTNKTEKDTTPATVTAATAPASAQAPASNIVMKTMAVGSAQLSYGVYVPKEYDKKKAWPLIVFLHGMGERGSDGVKQTTVGIGPAIGKNPGRFPCIVAMPQCPLGSVWNDRHDVIDATIAQCLADYNVDKRRIYLTGLSMGGYGAWSYGAAHTDVFAAIIPICGKGNPSDARALAAVPIRVFHGGADPVVDPAGSREMYEAIKQAGGNIEYTEYPNVGHNSWDQTYQNADVMQWMLKQKK